MNARALSLFILAAVVIVPVPVSARMYQWVHPGTDPSLVRAYGTVIFSMRTMR